MDLVDDKKVKEARCIVSSESFFVHYQLEMRRRSSVMKHGCCLSAVIMVWLSLSLLLPVKNKNRNSNLCAEAFLLVHSNPSLIPSCRTRQISTSASSSTRSSSSLISSTSQCLPSMVVKATTERPDSSSSSSAAEEGSAMGSKRKESSSSQRKKKAPRFVQRAHNSNSNNNVKKNKQHSKSDATNQSYDEIDLSNISRMSPFSMQDDDDDDRYDDDDYDSVAKEKDMFVSKQQQKIPKKFVRQERQVWESGKSIDELESTMTRRWGVLDESNMVDDDDDDDDDDLPLKSFSGTKKNKYGTETTTTTTTRTTTPGRRNGIKASDSNTKSDDANENPTGIDLRRPVFDPWQEEVDGEDTGKKNRRTNNNVKIGASSSSSYKQTTHREYYDEDDEGFEYYEIEDGEDISDYPYDDVDDDDDARHGSKISLNHLISPTPAGGRGSNSNGDSGDGGGTYFFNKPTTITTTAVPTKKTRKDKSSIDDDDDTEGEQQEKKQKKKRPTVATPLVDEFGQKMLLTVDEALRQFRMSVNDDSFVEEVIEAKDVAPIVAADQKQEQTWQDLGITSELLLENLAYMNCPTPLAVQAKTCPAAVTGNDVMVGTYTGSGKTLAFLAPLIQRMLWTLEDPYQQGSDKTVMDDGDEQTRRTTRQQSSSKKDVGLAVIIVAPGRELASQIVSVARDLLHDTGLSVQLAIGGTTFSRNLEQIRKRKPNIIVGTPGRIAELVVGKPGEKCGKLKIGALRALVLDEFDALLQYKAHRDPTNGILYMLKRRHGDALQSIFCSATASDAMDSSKVVEFLRPGYAIAMTDEDDLLVTEGSRKSNGKKRTQVSRTVLHAVVHVPHKRVVVETVRRILHTTPVPQQILIFVENARKVDVVVEQLQKRQIVAAPLHGGMGSEKTERAEVSKALREGYVGIVVATELAARGLDAPLLTHVINLDLPTDASHYAHRAGRCGRGGRPGIVINLTASPQERNVPRRFAESLGIEMHTAEPRSGELIMVDPTTVTLD